MKYFTKLLIIILTIFLLLSCNKEEVDLNQLLDNIENNIQKYEYDFAERYGDHINIVGPPHGPVESDLMLANIDEISYLLGIDKKTLTKTLNKDISYGYGIYEIFIKGNFLFVQLNKDKKGDKFYLVINKYLDIKKYDGIYFDGNKVFLKEGEKSNII